jgi:intracellular sulfur oxidation DsrE/DsrF family protein
MSRLFLPLFLILFSSSLYAQPKKLSVVWDLSSADTLVQAAVFRQINNARVLEPDLDIEVVFHGYAVKSLLLVEKSFEARIKAAKQKGVTLAVCNNSLKRLNINPSELMSETTIVPSAVVEIIKKQSEGWAYLKAGN